MWLDDEFDSKNNLKSEDDQQSNDQGYLRSDMAQL